MYQILKMRKNFLGYDKDGHPYLLLDQGVAAATSSIIAAAVTNPLEILRLRTQVREFSNIQNFFKDILLFINTFEYFNAVSHFSTSNIQLKSYFWL